MKLYIPAVWYRARAVVERRWGWSPVEEEVLLALRDKPGTSASIAKDHGIPRQVSETTVGRLMRFGLIEVRTSPQPALAMTDAARAHLHAGRPLPERSAQREMPVSLLFEKLGRSVFRRRDVRIVKRIPEGALVVAFPDGDEIETDASMESRVRYLLASSLRPGEVFAMVRANHSVVEEWLIEIDLDRARDGALPEGASEALRAAVGDFLASGQLPAARPAQPARPGCLDVDIETTLSPEQIVFGGADHLARLEAVVDTARSNIFVLSTFVAAQDDPKAHIGQGRVLAALERAVRRGVRVHLFFGSSLDQEGKHMRAMADLQGRLHAMGAGVAAHLDPVHSHAKILVADDGTDGAFALIGSCNWLQSPFRAHELSIELRDGPGVAGCLELFGAITAAVPTARDSRDVMQAMRTALRLRRMGLIEVPPLEGTIPATLRILAAPDHLPLLRRAAHDAVERLVVMTHRMGSPMIQNVFDPAQVASERITTVQALYSVPSGAVKKRDVRTASERCGPGVDVRKVQSRDAMLHGKALLWDHDDIVVTSFNWGSQTASEQKPLDEIGLHLHGNGIADILHSVLEARVRVHAIPTNGASLK